MAFGKKKKDEEPQDAAPAPDAESPAEDETELSGTMFEAPAPEPNDPIAAGLLAEEKAAASSDALGSDLLNMFQTTQIEVDDLSVILDLAGEVEFDDLLEELHTVAAALGCKLDIAGAA